MTRRQKQQRRTAPLETSVVGPEEMVVVPSDPETPVAMPKEPGDHRVCGVNGCKTWYDDPVVMQRHMERQHGIGVRNLNRPGPRHGAA